MADQITGTTKIGFNGVLKKIQEWGRRPLLQLFD